MASLFSIFHRQAPAPEAKSLAAPSVDLLELFGAVPTGAGVAISTEQAIRVPAVSCAIRTISEAAGSLDLAVKRRLADGTEADEPGHPVAALLRGDVNDWTSGSEFITGLVADALISDAGGLAHAGRTSDGRLVEIIPYRRGVVQVQRHPVTGEPSFRIDNRELVPSATVWLRSPCDRAPLSLAKDAIGLAAVLERHAANLFSRGARPSGTLTFQRGMAEDAVKKSIAAWRAAHEGPDAAGRTAILHDGAEFKALALSSADAQFLELRLFQIQEIARAFNIPAPMLGDLSRATWANLESKHREFWSTTLEPWLLALEAALGRALFTPEDRAAGFVIRFDRDDFGRADLTARATAINSLIASRVLNPNEGRTWLGLAPREGGDEFANPNITTAPADTPEPEEEHGPA